MFGLALAAVMSWETPDYFRSFHLKSITYNYEHYLIILERIEADSIYSLLFRKSRCLKFF